MAHQNGNGTWTSPTFANNTDLYCYLCSVWSTAHLVCSCGLLSHICMACCSKWSCERSGKLGAWRWCGHYGNDVMEACMAPHSHIWWCIILWSAIMSQDGDAYGNPVTFNKCCLSHVWYQRWSCSGIGNTHTLAFASVKTWHVIFVNLKWTNS